MQLDLGTAGFCLTSLTSLPVFLYIKITRSLKIAIVAIIALSAAWMFLFSGMDYLVKKGVVKS
jgi:hypothetical protein